MVGKTPRNRGFFIGGNILRNYYYSLKQNGQNKGFAITYGCGGPNIMPLFYETVELFCEPEDGAGTYEVWLVGYAGERLEKEWCNKKGHINFYHGFPFEKKDGRIIINDVWFGEGENHFIECDQDYSAYYIKREKT